MEFSHEVGNGHVLLTPTPEASGCLPDDALTCLLFLFRWITHIDSLDDIYHLKVYVSTPVVTEHAVGFAIRVVSLTPNCAVSITDQSWVLRSFRKGCTDSSPLP